MEEIMTQLSLKAGLKYWGTKPHKVVQSETNKTNFREIFKPMHWKELDYNQSKSVLESHTFLKKKRDGKTKDGKWLV